MIAVQHIHTPLISANNVVQVQPRRMMVLDHYVTEANFIMTVLVVEVHLCHAQVVRSVSHVQVMKILSGGTLALLKWSKFSILWCQLIKSSILNRSTELIWN